MSSPLLTLCVCICILCCATWKSFLWKYFSCFHCGMVAALKLTAPPRQFLKSEGTCIAFDQGDGFLCGFYHAAQEREKWNFISPKRTRHLAHHPESKEKVELEEVQCQNQGMKPLLLIQCHGQFLCVGPLPCSIYREPWTSTSPERTWHQAHKPWD